MEWKIDLPEQCPPEEARPRPGTYLRLVAEQRVDDLSFASQHEQGLKKPAFANDCEWASCSLLVYDGEETDPFRRARDFSRLKSLRKKFRFLAKIELGEDCGVVTTDPAKPVHYHLWAFKHSPQPIVLEFVEAANDE